MSASPADRTDAGTDAPGRVPLAVHAPVPGRVLPLADVPDPVFAEGMVGPGVALDPERGPLTALSPVAGRLLTVHPHAFVVTTGDGRGVLVHLGVDTVDLHGQGFEPHVAVGDEVAVGAPVVSWDPADVERGGRSPLCPVVALDAAADELVPEEGGAGPKGAAGAVAAGDRVFTWR